MAGIEILIISLNENLVKLGGAQTNSEPNIGPAIYNTFYLPVMISSENTDSDF